MPPPGPLAGSHQVKFERSGSGPVSVVAAAGAAEESSSPSPRKDGLLFHGGSGGGSSAGAHLPSPCAAADTDAEAGIGAGAHHSYKHKDLDIEELLASGRNPGQQVTPVWASALSMSRMPCRTVVFKRAFGFQAQ
jgi:hypothetical protein